MVEKMVEKMIVKMVVKMVDLMISITSKSNDELVKIVFAML